MCGCQKPNCHHIRATTFPMRFGTDQNTLRKLLDSLNKKAESKPAR